MLENFFRTGHQSISDLLKSSAELKEIEFNSICTISFRKYRFY